MQHKSIIKLIVIFTILFTPSVRSQEIPETSEQDLTELSNINPNNGQELPLTLADAVYLAIENNQDFKKAYLQRILDQKELAEVESKFNPTFTPNLSLSFSDNQTGDQETTDKIGSIGLDFELKIPTGGNISLGWQGKNQLSSDNQSDPTNSNNLSQGLTIDFTQPLLRGFGLKLNRIDIEKAQLTERENILNFQNTKAQIITDTISSYRQLLLAQETLKVEQISFENAQKDLARLQALFEFGRIPRNDLVERQADIAQQRVTLLSRENNVENAITRLNLILDLPIPQRIVAIETPTAPERLELPSYEEMLELALENNNDYLAALNGVETAKLNLLESENQQLWNLNLNVNYSYDSASNSSDQGNFQSSLNFSREFGNLSQDQAVEKSQVNLEIATISLANTRQTLEENLKTKIRDLEDSFQAIKLQQEALQLARTRLNNARERMRLGQSITMKDIIDFEQQLVTSKNLELNAIIDYLNQVTDLEQFLGTTLDEWLKN
jgi:outer membrane protein